MTSALEELMLLWQGQIVAPPNLSGVIAISLAGNATADIQSMIAAARLDFPALPQTGRDVNALAAPARSNLVGLLGWTIDTLSNWTPGTDPNGAKLEGALVAVSHWTSCGDFWVLTLHILSQRPILTAAFELVLRQRSTTFQTRPAARIWEREHLLALQQAEAVQDWVSLAELTAVFKLRQRLDCSASQALCGLFVLDLPRLTKFVDRLASWSDASFLFMALPLEHALRLASASTNDNFRFAAIEAIAAPITSFPSSSSPALVKFLIALAHDGTAWPAWIRILNRFPVRHPKIQDALGRALARSPDNALMSYVEAIELTTPQAHGRAQVAECLKAFRHYASSARRRVLWRAAFDRWADWDFGDDDSPSPMSHCELDYAVAAWLIEFADGSFLALEMSSFETRLRALEASWHPSSVKLTAKYNRILSKYRMIAFAANRRGAAGSWLLGSETFLPSIITASEYLKARYRMS